MKNMPGKLKCSFPFFIKLKATRLIIYLIMNTMYGPAMAV